jgi:two-component system cell cycle response regulator DivK
MLMLEQQKYEVVQAATGEDGLRMADELKPDLILMDINLPDIDGVECTRRIKANPVLKHIPVVALTANAMVGDKESYLAAGCDAYLRKPLARADLQGVLARFLNAKIEIKRMTTGPLRLISEPDPRSLL